LLAHIQTCELSHSATLFFSIDSHGTSGGGNIRNLDLNRFGPALRWMSYEAISNGLRMHPFSKKWERPKRNESLTGFWKVLEYMPFGRLTYESEEATTSW
jgi:hypothetical protein